MHRTRRPCLNILFEKIQRNNVTYRQLYIQCVSVEARVSKNGTNQWNPNCHLRPRETSACLAKRVLRGKRRVMVKGGVCVGHTLMWETSVNKTLLCRVKIMAGILLQGDLLSQVFSLNNHCPKTVMLSSCQMWTKLNNRLQSRVTANEFTQLARFTLSFTFDKNIFGPPTHPHVAGFHLRHPSFYEDTTFGEDIYCTRVYVVFVRMAVYMGLFILFTTLLALSSIAKICPAMKPHL